MIRGTFFILIALFIDLLQASIAFGISIIAAFPGTAGGAAAGCVAGEQVAGQIGCWIGGGVLTVLGSALNPIIAPVTIPIGTAAAFAINICLSLTLGAGLVTAMLFFQLHPRVSRLIWGGGELLPGFNILPFWTAFVVFTLLQKEAQTGGVAGITAGALTQTNNPAQGVKNVLSTSRLAPTRPTSELSEAPQVQPASQNSRPALQDIRLRRAIAILLGLSLALPAAPALHAQSLSQPDPIQFSITPEVPGPNQIVQIQVQGVGTFLGDAMITWQKDGVTAKNGVGERTYSFTSGALGVVTRIRVVIDSATQGTITRTFTFIPSTVNLIWEADTSVPPLYRGKALYSAGSRLKVVAFPQVVANGTTLSANNLSFQWKINGEKVTAQSGKGKNQITFNGSQLNAAETVAVDVYFDTVLVGQGNVVIPAVNPVILLYVRDPLRGVIYDQALPSAISLIGQEITVQATPYFFSRESFSNGTLAYEWTLNGTPTTGPEAAQGALTLRQTGQGSGSAQVGVSLQNLDSSKFLQAAETALRIVFGQQSNSSGTSFFGL